MKNPGFIKRFLLIIYDGLLMVAALMVTSFILMAVIMMLAPDSFFVDPASLENPKMIQLSETGRLIGNIIVSINSLVVSFVFYGWFWTHGGQTLGMRAWNLYLIKPDGKFINWKLAGVRYCLALISWIPFVFGFIWIILSREKLAWHDSLSGSRIVFVPKEKQPSKT